MKEEIKKYSMDEVAKKVGNKYLLTLVLAKRAKEVLKDTELAKFINLSNVFDWVMHEIMTEQIVIEEYVEPEKPDALSSFLVEDE